MNAVLTIGLCGSGLVSSEAPKRFEVEFFNNLLRTYRHSKGYAFSLPPTQLPQSVSNILFVPSFSRLAYASNLPRPDPPRPQ